MSKRGKVILVGLCTFMVIPALAAGPGEVHLSWDPSDGAVGYTVHWGTSGPGVYTANSNAPSPAYDLTGMDDCTTYWITTTAYNAGGSSGYSNEVETWPRPRVSAVTCLGGTTVQPGDSITCTVTGDNLRENATVSLLDPSGNALAGVTPTAEPTITTFCHALRFAVTLPAPSICPGGCMLGLRVTNPSGVSSVPVSALTVEEPDEPSEIPQAPTLRVVD